MKTDAQIQQDVINQLKWNPELEASEIGVSVHHGIVTLSGQVDTYFKKFEAERAAKKVSGVKAIAEDIHVGISTAMFRTDTEIAEAVVKALKWHTSIDDQKIKVKVENSSVTLEGQVDWEYQREAAKTAIINFAGVKNVFNLITIKPQLVPSDLQQKINSAFHRSAIIDGSKVKVDVLGSKVVLKGKVRSFSEREDAEEAVWAAPGVTSIENKLEVEEEEYSF